MFSIQILNHAQITFQHAIMQTFSKCKNLLPTFSKYSQNTCFKHVNTVCDNIDWR